MTTHAEERACERCGAPYTARKSWARYCSPHCRTRQNNEIRAALLVPCRWCNQPTKRRTRGGWAGTCSYTCGMALRQYERNGTAPHTPWVSYPAQSTCRRCNRPFLHNPTKQRVYCSDRCRVRAGYAWRPCRYCDTPIRTSTEGTTLPPRPICTPCQDIAQIYAGQPGRCGICGQPRPGGRRRLCDRCKARREAHGIRKYPPEATLEAVLERDRWICHLCGQRIAHLHDATRDHLIPAAQGGGHDLGNLAAAHRLCNSMRGDTPLEEWHAHTLTRPAMSV